MSNHSSDSIMNEEMIREMGLGATNNFPQGKLHPTDEGEIKMAISTKDNKVIIVFGKPTAWIGMDKEQAIQLGKTIIKKAEEML